MTHFVTRVCQPLTEQRLLIFRLRDTAGYAVCDAVNATFDVTGLHMVLRWLTRLVTRLDRTVRQRPPLAVRDTCIDVADCA